MIFIKEDLQAAIIGENIEERPPYKDFKKTYLKNEIQVVSNLTKF